MRVSRQKAAANRERIIDAAGVLFRAKGFDGIGVADIMKAAELTHGGLYGHFAIANPGQPHRSICSLNVLDGAGRLYTLQPAPRKGASLVPSRGGCPTINQGAGEFVMRAGVLSALAVGLALAACAGRDPQPIATVQPQDANSDCAMINAEIQANNKRAEALASEQNGKTAQNIAAGVVGVVIWPVWFAMDTKGAAGTEAAALQARQEYLANLAAQRCAAPVPPAVTPQRR
jgi:hypothetical protein